MLGAGNRKDGYLEGGGYLVSWCFGHLAELSDASVYNPDYAKWRYAHILDEDRKINAQKFESAFYANPDLRSVRPPEEPKEPAPAALDLEALVEQLRRSPELANTLAVLLSTAPGGK